MVEDARQTMRHPMVRRSALGLAAIYNQPPSSFVRSTTVSDFNTNRKSLSKPELVQVVLTGGCHCHQGYPWMDALSCQQK